MGHLDQVLNEIQINFFPGIWKPISAKTRNILQWMKCVSHEKKCIFQL